MTEPAITHSQEYKKARENGKLRMDARAVADISQTAVRAQQDSVLRGVPKEWKVAEIIRDGRVQPARFSLLTNAMVIDTGSTKFGDASRILWAIPGVKSVSPSRKYVPTLYDSRPQIGIDEAYEILGVTNDDAGKGIRVAVIDEGIYAENAMFSGEGMACPEGVDASSICETEGCSGDGGICNCNCKVIVSRAYFDPDDMPDPTDASSFPNATSVDNHGLHCGAIAAGRSVIAEYNGEQINITGVAPGAWVLNYRALYTHVDGDAYGSDDGLLAAFEDAFLDGANVISNSWGSSTNFGAEAQEAHYGDIIKALDEEGVVVVFSSGNNGPNSLSATGVPGPIRVGALTKDVVRTDRLAVFDIEGTEISVPLGYVNDVTAGEYILTIPDDSEQYNTSYIFFCGSVMEAESCSIEAMTKGAGGVLVQHTEIGYLGEQPDAVGMNVMFGDLGKLLEALGQMPSPGDELAFHVADETWTTDVDPYIIGFSSRGPTGTFNMGVEIAAPGVDILSAGYGTSGEPRMGFSKASGTSMACPHVSGAAALLLQKYPEFGHKEVKSALMSTAKWRELTTSNVPDPSPLAHGAGALHLPSALEPSLFIDPPAVDLGKVDIGVGAVNRRVTLEVTTYADLFVHSGKPVGEISVHVAAFGTSGAGTDQISVVGGVDASGNIVFNGVGDKKTIELEVDLEGLITMFELEAYIEFQSPDNADEVYGVVPVWGRAHYVSEPSGGRKKLGAFVVSGVDDADLVDKYTAVVKTLFDEALFYVGPLFTATGSNEMTLEALCGAFDAVILASDAQAAPIMAAFEGGFEVITKQMMYAGVPVIFMGPTVFTDFSYANYDDTAPVLYPRDYYTALEVGAVPSKVGVVNPSPVSNDPLLESAGFNGTVTLTGTIPTWQDAYGLLQVAPHIFASADQSEERLLAWSTRSIEMVDGIFKDYIRTALFGSVIGLDEVDEQAAQALLQTAYDAVTEKPAMAIHLVGDGLQVVVQATFTGADARLLMLDWGDGDTSTHDVEGNEVKATHTYAAYDTYFMHGIMFTESGRHYLDFGVATPTPASSSQLSSSSTRKSSDDSGYSTPESPGDQDPPSQNPSASAINIANAFIVLACIIFSWWL